MHHSKYYIKNTYSATKLLYVRKLSKDIILTNDYTIFSAFLEENVAFKNADTVYFWFSFILILCDNFLSIPQFYNTYNKTATQGNTCGIDTAKQNKISLRISNNIIISCWQTSSMKHRLCHYSFCLAHGLIFIRPAKFVYNIS